jgi:Spy/CpxP family protein refolding chaperone
MKHLHWTKAVLLAAAVLALIALPLAAQHAAVSATTGATGAPGEGGHAGMLAAHIHGMVKELNLTDDQKAAAKPIFQEIHAQAQPIHQQLGTIHQQLQTALNSPSPDATAIGNLVIQSHQLMQQMKPILEAADQKFQAILTPDQLTKYQALKASHDFPGGLMKHGMVGMGH